MENASIYIHIPFCVSKCAYCDFFSIGKNNEVPESYILALCNELCFRLSFFDVKSISTIYIGGGTPSLLKVNQLEKIFSCIKDCCLINADAEITIEANPDDITEEFVQAVCSTGINRISIGIQTLNDKSLKFVNRRANREQNLRALELLSHTPDVIFSVDLICGLPFETEQSFMETMETVVSYKPCHISMYSLTLEDGTELCNKIDSGLISYDFDAADKLWLCANDRLIKMGYKHYEISNYCRQGKECRHNLVYWQHKPYIGCGSGAAGTVYNKAGEGFRWNNSTKLSLYTEFWKEHCAATQQGGGAAFDFAVLKENAGPGDTEIVDLDTSIYEFFMMTMRKSEGFKKSEFKVCFNQAVPGNFLKLMEEWAERGHAVVEKMGDGDVRYALTEKGLLFLNAFLEKL